MVYSELNYEIIADDIAVTTVTLHNLTFRFHHDLQDQNDKILDTDKPPVALNGTLQKEEETKGTNEKENKQIDKLEKLIKAKENSIKTFISKNDSLTQELLATKEHLREKDNVLRSVNESLQAVVDRCSYKTKQFEDMEEKCEYLTDQNRIIENELDQLKRKFVDLESECQDYMRLNDDNKDVIGNQKQLLRRREEEILELRRECQEQQDREKSSVESIKKRADRSFTEAEEVQVQLKKLREKMEKEKRDLFEEIQNSERAKADISAKLLTTENHLKKSKDENMNAANNLSFTQSELHDLQLKFNGTMKEKNIMKDDMANLELKMNTTLSENKLMRKELDNVKIEKDTLSQQKASLNNRISALQKELENEKEKCSKKEISIEEYKRQCQQYQQDINMANSRSDDIVKSTMEEEEVARRKWQNRLQDSEDEIARLTARLKVSEKSKADQGAELEQVSFDLNQLTKNFGALEKKRQQDEQIINEQHMLEQESNEKIETMKRRMTDYSGQLASLKQEYEEEIAQNRGLRLKLKSVQDELSDEQHEKENNERKQLDMSRTIARLQEQIEAQNVAISELEGDLEGSSARADKAHKEMLFSMEQQTNTVSEKDEEIELVKKTCRGTINLLKQQLDDAEQEIHRLNMIKGDLEQEIVLTQGDLDEAEATVNELNNEIPRQQDILEQLNMSLSDMSGKCEALQDALVRADNKCTQLQGRNEQLETDLNKEESSKRQLVQDNIDLNNKIAEHGARMESLQDTMIKLEEQLLGQSQVLETLEDEKSEWVLEKRKMREIITALEADNHHLDESRDTLEQSEKKLKSRIQGLLSDHEDALGTLRQTHRNRLRVLESRVAELEHALEDETEERTNHEKTVKKLERMLNDMELQSREDTKSIERQVEQISNLSTRNKNLKVACANSESRITTLQSRLRKLTAEMEESENRAATMSKMLSSPAGSRCGTPASLRQSAMIRSSLVGSRSVSRLISPEVEHIIMSGRNSPVGPLAPISPGYMSPRSISVQDGTDCGSNFDFEEKINGSHYVESDAKDSEIEQSNGEGIGLEQDTGTSEKVSDLENAQSTVPPQVLITISGNDKIENNADPKEDKSDM